MKKIAISLLSTSSSGCIFSDGRSVSSNLCCNDVDLCNDHERSVHELHHSSVLLLSVPSVTCCCPAVTMLCRH